MDLVRFLLVFSCHCTVFYGYELVWHNKYIWMRILRYSMIYLATNHLSMASRNSAISSRCNSILVTSAWKKTNENLTKSIFTKYIKIIVRVSCYFQTAVFTTLILHWVDPQLRLLSNRLIPHTTTTFLSFNVLSMLQLETHRPQVQVLKLLT